METQITPSQQDRMPTKSMERPHPSVVDALENILILSKILSYIPARSLKQCRLVNILWNYEASKFYFQKHSVLSFKSYEHDKHFDSAEKCSKMKFNSHDEFETKIELIYNFNIRAFHLDLMEASTWKSPQMQNSFKNLTWLMNTYGSGLKYFKLSINIDNYHRENYHLLDTIFKNLTSLEEMVLDMNIGKDLAQDGGYNFGNPLSSVRILRLPDTCFSVNNTMEVLRSNVAVIARLFPNVESIICHESFVMQALLHLHLPKILPLCNLQKLDIIIKCCTYNCTTLEILAKLARMHKDLNTLNIRIQSIPRAGGHVVDGLVDVLKRHGPTLSSLRIRISHDIGDEPVVITFPACPQLQTLEINVEENLHKRGSIGTVVFKLPQPPCHNSDFPKLKNVKLKACHICWGDFNASTALLSNEIFLGLRTWEKFIKKKCVTIKSMKRLKYIYHPVNQIE